jgi:acetyl-CoA carboxylase biotin carboxyl carrier protein
MDLRKLKTLIDLVADSNITELEVTEGEEKVKIVKGGGTYIQAAPTMMTAAAPQSFAPAMAAASAPASVASEAPALTGKIIKSPMVGTFYAAPAPDKSDFVNVGSSVKSAQTVCIIEAMKLLNEIESGFDGTITEILVQNGTAVEFGQPLFVVA